MQHLALCDWLLLLGVVLQAQWCCHMQLEPSLPLGGGGATHGSSRLVLPKVN